MNRRIVVTALGSALAAGVGLVLAGPRDEHSNRDRSEDQAAEVFPVCPVSGEPVNLAVSVAADEGPVFFCCQACIPKYQANRSQYANGVTGQREAPARRAKVQVTCPVSGEPADQKVFIDRGGDKVYFCCKGCIKKFRRDPAKCKTALANSYTYQTMCPVTGQEIDPQAFTKTAHGHSIYFCCNGCDKKLFSDPAKYFPNLEGQGLELKPDEMKHGE
jgi:YHS domain-containing protein